MNKTKDRFFTKALLEWHDDQNDRTLPWKGEKDPYKIWLSEILLQQTQAAQALPYYERFILTYPNLKKLANAKDEAVFKLWEGLGYYSRCRNLLATARYIEKELKGIFPNQYQEILALKGVGPYTAAAVASFAFNLPYPVLDGNVYRILARYFGITEPIDTPKGKKQIEAYLNNVFPPKKAAQFNQGLMDFGATVCKPKPFCELCPLQKKCAAYILGKVGILPIKIKKIKVRTRHFNYWVIKWRDKVYVQQRKNGDIWQDLYEFYLVESEENTLPAFMKLQEIISYSANIFTNQQRLTHQIIKSSFSIITLKNQPVFLKEAGLWVDRKSLKNYPFAKTILLFLDEKPYF